MVAWTKMNTSSFHKQKLNKLNKLKCININTKVTNCFVKYHQTRSNKINWIK